LIRKRKDIFGKKIINLEDSLLAEDFLIISNNAKRINYIDKIQNSNYDEHFWCADIEF
jgi:uncharacterized protein YegJ (DUF2314 family)